MIETILNEKYRHLSHVTYDCRYHVVFVPKYRRKILEGDIAKYAQQVFQEVCEWKEIVILQGEVRGDHVHLYLSIPPKYSISDVLQWLKGKSATRLFERFPDLRKMFWGSHLWVRGYFVSTVGITDEIIRAYIAKQDEQERLEEELLKQQRLWR